MLGYWSLGDYFKRESIHYTFDFYTQVLGFKADDISVTVFKGDEDAPFDEESYNVWRDEIGIPVERIYKYGKKENWWGPAGLTGPCGPDTEMFIDTGKESCSDKCGPVCNCGKFIEIGNNVFMQYNKTKSGKYEELKQKNVDVGLGLERLTMFVQGADSVYETDLFINIIEKIKEVSSKTYQDDKKTFRIIADHLRAAVFILGDDNSTTPSNTLQGYILRRLIRRAISYGKKIEAIEGFVARVAEVIVDKYKDTYPELEKNREKILSELDQEEIRFGKSLEKGLKKYENQISNFQCQTKIKDQNSNAKILDTKFVFDLYQSYGFPFEMVKELATEDGFEVDEEGFKKEFEKHQDLSRTASAGMFKGGLADSGEETTKLHTAAHLLLASLRQVLGSEFGEINQKGSNITAERLRFDFNYPQKLTEEQLKKVEDLVNKKIQDAIDVEMMELSLEDAKNIGATGVFESKYGNRVKVYKIEGIPSTGSGQTFSLEICGGPHVTNTKELGQFKIIKEESSSSGIRRIKAIVG
jgi:alanyl-tRNA synthetase